MYSSLTLLSAISALFSPTAYTSPVLTDQDLYSQPPTTQLAVQQTICVTPQPFYPSWEGTPLVDGDCRNAWNNLYLRVGPRTQQQRPYTYWFQDPAPKQPLNHQTPFGQIEGTRDPLQIDCRGEAHDTFLQGTCHVSIAMLKSIPPRSGTDRVLPEVMTHDYDTLPVTDTATLGDIDDAINRVAWCLTNLGTPGAWVTGKKNAIGVFFWSSDSKISRDYPPGVGIGVGVNVVNNGTDLVGATVVGSDATE